MRRRLILLQLASVCVAAPKKGKSPEVSVVQVICRRVGDDVALDGRLKVGGARPLKKIRLLFDFLGTDKQLLETKRGEVDEDLLAPGEEAEFHLRVADPVRAVLYSIRAEESDGRELNVERAGPFPIE
jgi:hypothetical protein